MHKFAESPRLLGTLSGGKKTQVVLMWLIISFLFSPFKDAVSNLHAWDFYARETKCKMMKRRQNVKG